MKRLIILFLLVSGISGPLLAQDLQRIVAVVNDEVISLRDITERSRIIIATARLPDNADVRRAVREQALRSLIDERLQMQEAKRRGISITQGEIDTAVAQIERQMNIPPGRFEEFTSRAGIDANMIISQIRSELTWTRMVRSRLMSSTTTTDQEIDEAIAKLRSAAGQTEDLLSEILIRSIRRTRKKPSARMPCRFFSRRGPVPVFRPLPASSAVAPPRRMAAMSAGFSAVRLPKKWNGRFPVCNPDRYRNQSVPLAATCSWHCGTVAALPCRAPRTARSR